jgi:hypothetical protein
LVAYEAAADPARIPFTYSLAVVPSNVPTTWLQEFSVAVLPMVPLYAMPFPSASHHLLEESIPRKNPRTVPAPSS